MAVATNFCIITFLLAYLNSYTVMGRVCAQCTFSDPACRSGNFMPRMCAGEERYCYTLNVYVGRAQGTYRGCSARDIDEACREVTVRQRTGTACMSTCDWDSCNSSYRHMMALLNRRR